jgi:hypothetical protein
MQYFRRVPASKAYKNMQKRRISLEC